MNGVLVFAVAGLSVRDISLCAIANLEYEEVKHLAPTFHGDTLYAESTVLDKWESKGKPDRGGGLCGDAGIQPARRDRSHLPPQGLAI